MNLYTAHHEWASRPDDERFSSLADLHRVVKARDDDSMEDLAPDIRSTRVATLEDGRMVVADAAMPRPSILTNWSMGQLAQRLEVPRVLLPRLSPRVVAEVLNDRLARTVEPLPGAALLGHNGEAYPTLRALTSQRYERLWDSKVVEATMARLPDGWRNPVAFEKGERGSEVRPSGLYASDRDVFLFLINGGDALDLGKDGEAHRGIIVWNSEVGAASFGWMEFLFEEVCCNHIIWGASEVNMHRGVHIRGVQEVFNLYLQFLDFLNSRDPSRFMAEVEAARADMAVPVLPDLAKTLDAAVPAFRKHALGTGEVRAALNAMVSEVREPRGSRWDWLQGFTASARRLPHMDARVDLEKRASKALLEGRYA